MHAYSDIDLRQFDLCKFFSVFLVFQCGTSGQYFEASERGRVQSFERFIFGVRTVLEPCRPDDPCLTSGQALASSSGRRLNIVWTRTTCLLFSEAASVWMSSLHRSDGDPTTTIKTPDRRTLSLPHKICFLAACELVIFKLFRVLLIPCLFQVFF